VRCVNDNIGGCSDADGAMTGAEKRNEKENMMMMVIVMLVVIVLR
jgi:predicted nucleic acid-binding Zn ribbon protein